MKILFKKDYRGLKKGDIIPISEHVANIWVGRNGTGKSTVSQLLYTYLSKNNKKLKKDHYYPQEDTSQLRDSDIIEIEDPFLVSEIVVSSDKLKKSVMSDMGVLIGIGMESMWRSEGTNAQHDIKNALLDKKPNKLLIFDETDGHLDYKTKKLFFEQIIYGFGKNTPIIISHESKFLKNLLVFDFDDKKEKLGAEFYNKED